MTIGERIKQRRLELGYSQEELAKKVGYKSRSSINKLELSRVLPSRKITTMAKALNTTEGYLMGWEEPDVIITSMDTDAEFVIDCMDKMSPTSKDALISYVEFLMEKEGKSEDRENRQQIPCQKNV